jgi:uncharacterized phosphosugar-binding protein
VASKTSVGEFAYLSATRDILNTIELSQADAIHQAANLMARSIVADGLVHMFGAGHSTLPVAEAYPKCGNLVGFHPIVELALSYFTNVVDSNGIMQFTFLERVEGYGEAILQSYILEPRDTMLIFSQSGINSVVIDVALGAKRRGLPVVSVMSLAQATALPARHSSGCRLNEISDIVIDNCVPFGDVTVHLPGMDESMGPASTLAAIAIVNTLIVEVARNLVAMGKKPLINPTLNAPGLVVEADKRMEHALEEYRRRTRRCRGSNTE